MVSPVAGYYWATDEIGNKRELIQFGDGIVAHFGIQGGSSQFAYHDYVPVATEDDVRELVDALGNLALSGVDDFGGSYVNLQADRTDIEKAREVLAKWEEKK